MDVIDNSNKSLSINMMIREQDIFLLGTIHCLKSIMKAMEDTGEDVADIDFEHVLDMQRRNLTDPDLEEYIKDCSDLEDLQ